MLHYEKMTLEDAFSKGHINYKPFRDYALGVFRVEDGVYTLLGSDCGEPEDATFYRDHAWVLGELAYAQRHGPNPEPAVVVDSNTTQADIRKRATDYKARRDGATTPTDRALYKLRLSEVRGECKHPRFIDASQSKDCLDCGLSF